MIFTEALPGALTYAQYRAMIDALLAEGKTTSGEQTADTLEYAKLNVQRMHRLDTTLVLSDELVLAVDAIARAQTWIVITEGWCGDAAQNVPMLARAAERNPLVSLQIILRDAHPGIMDRFLTNGTRSIPILVIVDTETRAVLGVWGPRPLPAKNVVMTVKLNPAATKDDMLIALHGWYAKDRTVSAQHELAGLLALPRGD